MLDSLRDQIDHIDQQLLELINQRASLAKAIAVEKDKQQEGNYYCPQREAQILEVLSAGNKGPLSDDQIARIYRCIMTACLECEQAQIKNNPEELLKKAQIWVLGNEYSLVHQVAVQVFNQYADKIHHHTTKSQTPTFLTPSLLETLDNNQIKHLVVPSLANTVGLAKKTLYSLYKSQTKISALIKAPVEITILAKNKIDPKQLKRLYIAKDLLPICSVWVNNTVPHAQLTLVVDDQEAKNRLKNNPSDDGAAIVAEFAFHSSEFEILDRDIVKPPYDKNHFFVLGNQAIASSQQTMKYTLAVLVSHHSGALYGVLEPFQKQRISILRLETVQDKSHKDCYLFFIEFNANQTKKPIVENIINQLKLYVVDLSIIGEYPIIYMDK